MSGLECLLLFSVSCRYINLEVRAGTLSLYVTLLFYVELYNHAILEVIQATCNLDQSGPPLPLRLLQLCSSINFTQVRVLIELQDAVSMENRTLSSSVRDCRGK